MRVIITGMGDPNFEEMLAVLEAYPYFNEASDFDWQSAIYWFANDWHGGQWSSLYSVLSTSSYRPGVLENCVDPNSMAHDLYCELENAFGFNT